MPVDGRIGTGIMPGVFAQAGMEYAYKHGGVGFEQFARVGEKNHAHSTLNPLAAYQKRFTLEEIMDDEMISYPNTLPMCCPTATAPPRSCSSSGEKLRTLSAEQQRRAVKVSASVLTTDPYEPSCQVQPDVNTLTRNAATQAYEQAGVGPEDLDLVELHDCFATAELIHYDNLGLCEPGGAGKFIDERGPWRDGDDPGQRVRRPASRRATRSARPASPTSTRSPRTCAARPATARSRAPRSGLAHVIGLGSACAVHILEAAA